MKSLLDDLHDEARAELAASIRLRRRLHESPELGVVLPETQRAVLEALGDLDVEIETGGATSAVVATLRGATPGPTILLRADMDALPMKEETGLAFASQHEGRMHACGHDAHVAMLAGAARLLARRRNAFAGTVKLLFQPGEEGHGGAVENSLIAVSGSGDLKIGPAPADTIDQQQNNDRRQSGKADKQRPVHPSYDHMQDLRCP